jgi:LEA14-like dessication related protein
MKLPTNLKNKTNVLVASIMIVLISIFIFDITLYFTSKSKVKFIEKPVLGENTNSKEEIDYWRSFLVENPNYFSGWLTLSKLEFDTGNVYNAQEDLDRARQINPNSEKLKELEAYINK